MADSTKIFVKIHLGIVRKDNGHYVLCECCNKEIPFSKNFIVTPEDYLKMNGKYIHFKDFLNINKFCIGTYVNHPIDPQDVWMSSEQDVECFNQYLNQKGVMYDITSKIENDECMVWKPFGFPHNWSVDPVKFEFQ